MEQALELHSQTTTRRNHKQEKKHQRILHQALIRALLYQNPDVTGEFLLFSWD